jgi:DNA-3-methyladenine glycosylase II
VPVQINWCRRGGGRERGAGDGCAGARGLPPLALPGPYFWKDEGDVSVVAIIETEADLAKGAARLVALEPRFGPVVAAGPLPLRRRRTDLRRFCRRSWRSRCRRRVRPRSGRVWRRPGLTGRRPGRRWRMKFWGLRAQPPQAALSPCAGGGGDRLGPLARGRDRGGRRAPGGGPGIGRWTAEIYAKFALGHADVFAAGDLALQEARGGSSICRRGPASGAARHGRGLGAGPRGCRPRAVGLLPVGHRPGGRFVSRVLEYGRKGPVAGSAKSW